MAKKLYYPLKVLSEVKIKTKNMTAAMKPAKECIRTGQKIPENIWAEIDRCLDELIEVFPPERLRRM